MNEIKLPPLPEPTYRGPSGTGNYFDGYTKQTLQAYATAAIEADRKRTTDLISEYQKKIRALEAENHSLVSDLDDRQARGEPVAYGVLAANTGRMFQLELAEDYEDAGLGQMRPEYIVPLYEGPQPAKPDRGEPVALVRVTEDTRYGGKRMEVLRNDGAKLPDGDHYVYAAPQSQQIPEGQQRALQEFFVALDKALALDKSGSAWTHRPKGTTGERMRAWAEVHRLRAMLEAAPKTEGAK